MNLDGWIVQIDRDRDSPMPVSFILICITCMTIHFFLHLTASQQQLNQPMNWLDVQIPKTCLLWEMCMLASLHKFTKMHKSSLKPTL